MKALTLFGIQTNLDYKSYPVKLTFPFIYCKLFTLQRLIIGVLCLCLFLNISEPLKIWVGQSLSGRETLFHIQLQHLVKQVHGCKVGGEYCLVNNNNSFLWTLRLRKNIEVDKPESKNTEVEKPKLMHSSEVFPISSCDVSSNHCNMDFLIIPYSLERTQDSTRWVPRQTLTEVLDKM